MIFLLRPIVQGNVHPVGAHVPSDVAVLFDVGDVERERSLTPWLRGPLQIFSDSITARMTLLLLRRKAPPGSSGFARICARRLRA